jgi:hypothetical protein
LLEEEEKSGIYADEELVFAKDKEKEKEEKKNKDKYPEERHTLRAYITLLI